MRRTLGTVGLAAAMALAGTSTAQAVLTAQPIRPLEAAIEGEDVRGERFVVFQDDGACNEGAYTVTVRWGDGTETTGDIESSQGLDILGGVRSCEYQAGGRHTYTRPGSYVLSARICGATCIDAPGRAITVTGAEIKGEAASFPAVAGQQVSIPQVAEFNHDNRTTQGSQFTSVIDWGDGSTSPAPVSGSNGRFGVAGQHTYAAPGNYTVRVTLLEGGTAVAVSDAGTAVVSAVAGPAPVQQGAASRNVAFRPGLRMRAKQIRRKSLRRGVPITVSLPSATRSLTVNVVRSTGARRVGRVRVRVTGGTIVNGVRQVNLRVRMTKAIQRRMRPGVYALQFRVGNSGTISGLVRVRR
jgi:hypothetical protein